MSKTITIRALRCGCMRVSESVLYGNGINLKHSAHQIFARDEKRVVLPVYAFLIEHPQGRFLIDTGFPREMSPKGEYDPKAVSALLPKHLAPEQHRPVLRRVKLKAPAVIEDPLPVIRRRVHLQRVDELCLAEEGVPLRINLQQRILNGFQLHEYHRSYIIGRALESQRNRFCVILRNMSCNPLKKLIYFC